MRRILGGGGDPAAVNRELVLLKLSPPSDPLPAPPESVLASALPPRDALRDSDEREAESRSEVRPRDDESPPEVAVDDERDEGDPKVIARMTAAAMRCG